MATKTWSGANGSYTDGTQWSGGTPGPGDIGVINSGTVTASGVAFGGVTVNLNANSSAGGTLVLAGDTINSDSVLNVNNQDTYGASPVTTLNFQGANTNNGTINFQGTTTTVQFASGATLVNAGTINLVGASPQIQTGTSTTPPTITNNGTIRVTNTANTYQSPVFNAALTGNGAIVISVNGALDLRQAVGSGQTLSFTGGTAASSALQIDSPTSFQATVSGFVSSDRLIVTNIPYTGYTYTQTSGSSGTLTLLSGSTVEGSINLSGIYSQGTFSLQANSLGNTGTSNVVITTNVLNSTTGSTTSTGAGAVYRFFDTKFGTHFFTSDLGEANSVLVNRPDLVEETNGFGDVAQNNPGAEAVYRFFDTIHGTHFFTASASERDGLIANRHDLSYEPTSVFYEDATQQAGDVPVYRLFDTKYGTQFLTGNQAEYAGLTTPNSGTYRSDLSAEGVAFYAPSGSFKA